MIMDNDASASHDPASLLELSFQEAFLYCVIANNHTLPSKVLFFFAKQAAMQEKLPADDDSVVLLNFAPYTFEGATTAAPKVIVPLVVSLPQHAIVLHLYMSMPISESLSSCLIPSFSRTLSLRMVWSV